MPAHGACIKPAVSCCECCLDGRKPRQHTLQERTCLRGEVEAGPEESPKLHDIINMVADALRSHGLGCGQGWRQPAEQSFRIVTGLMAAQEAPVVEVSVRAGRAIKSQPGKNDDSPELHDIINMVVDDPEEQSLSVRLVDDEGLIKKVRWSGPVWVMHIKVCLRYPRCCARMRGSPGSKVPAVSGEPTSKLSPEFF